MRYIMDLEGKVAPGIFHRRFLQSIFILIVLFISTYSFADTYVSSYNSNHKIYILKLQSVARTIEEARNYSKNSCPGTVLYVRTAYKGWHYYLNGNVIDNQIDYLAEQEYLRKINYQEQKQHREENPSKIGIFLTYLTFFWWCTGPILVLIIGLVGLKAIIKFLLNK